MIELGRQDKSQLNFSKIGKWWHKNIEIDMVALNAETHDIFFFECKWKELREAAAIKMLDELKVKSKSVGWHQDDRREYFGLIAGKIENKDELKANGYLAFDLSDFLNF